MRRAAILFAVATVIVALWRPLLYPGGKAALLLATLYSPSLVGRDVTALVTPEPIARETRETFGGIEMRVSWWRPAWGDRHPAMMIVNGATPVGNDNVATREFGAALARAGYLVMLPEFPFLKEGRLDVDGPRVVDAAFAYLAALPETRERPVGAFGASVGAGLLLAAAGRYHALPRAAYLAVLGGYFDMRTYVAAVATRSQPAASGIAVWEPSDEAKQRIPPAVEDAMTSEADRAVVRRVFASPAYGDALDEIESLSVAGRDVFDRLSPSTDWASVRPPVFWIHDPNDPYEPVSEAYAARAAPRAGAFELIVPRLVQHAEVGGGARGLELAALVGELARLLGFALAVIRVAG